MVSVERDSCWKIGEVWICTRLSRMTVRWVCALFQQRGGGGDVIVIVLAVASRTMLQQVVAPNTSSKVILYRR